MIYQLKGLEILDGGTRQPLLRWVRQDWHEEPSVESDEAGNVVAHAVKGSSVRVRVWPKVEGDRGPFIQVDTSDRRGHFFTTPLRIDEGKLWYLFEGPVLRGGERSTLSIGEEGGRGADLGLVPLPGPPGAWQWDLADSLGEVELHFAGHRLPVLVTSCKLPADPSGDSLAPLESLLESVWKRHLALVRRLGRAPAIGLARGARPRSPIQSLMLLDRLLWAEGVAEAWDAFAAEPQTSLMICRPVVSFERARRPILHGARGPWTIPGGLDISGDVLRARDRRPTRTHDTPQNRLVVRLARLIEGQATVIDTALRPLVSSETGQASSWHGASGWSRRARRIAERAREIQSVPAMQEVDPFGPFEPDAPSLQLHPFCRPLLQAWAQLQEGVDFRRGAEHLFRDPLKTSFDLYEYWCWFELCQTVVEATGGWFGETIREWGGAADARVGRVSSELDLSWGLCRDVHLPDSRTVTVHYNQSAPSGSGARPYGSYSRRFRPDLAMAIKDPQRQMIDLILFDAKYRVDFDKVFEADDELEASGRLTTIGRAKTDDLKVMHGYRDAIRWRGPDAQLRPPRWVLALYPGNQTVFYCEHGERIRSHEGLAAARSSGGVGAVQLSPGRSTELLLVLQVLLGQVVAPTVSRETSAVPSPIASDTLAGALVLAAPALEGGGV